MEAWLQDKLHCIGLLVSHYQPELVENFFNSVTIKILHRTRFHNDFIFVRLAVSTEPIESSSLRALPAVPTTLRAPPCTPAANDGGARCAAVR